MKLNFLLLIPVVALSVCGCDDSVRYPDSGDESVRYPGSCAVEDFGKTSRGEKVEKLTIDNGNGVIMEFLDYGARVKSIRVGKKQQDITIGFDDVASYEKYDYGINAVTGRFANRIANGKFTLDGQEYSLFLNNGPEGKPFVCSLHGGQSGFADKVWVSEPLFDEEKGMGVKYTYVSPDGEEGYPGKMTTTVRYYLSPKGVWRAEYEASVEGKPTVFNLTNHIYFNLHGDDNGDTLDQTLQFCADFTTPVDVNLIPSGELAPVAGTPFDFNKPISQGAHCRELDNVQLSHGGGYDHNWVLRKKSELDSFGCSKELELAAIMNDPSTKRRVEIWTTEPAMQMWGGQGLVKKGPDRRGNPRRPYGALALETQHYPDSPNRPDFPRTVLRPGEVYRSVTEYRIFAPGE